MSRRLLIAAFAATIALSACGDGTKKETAAGVEITTTTLAPTTTTTAAPATTTTAVKVAITKAAYITQANAICKVMNAKTDAIPDPGEDLAKLVAGFEQSKQITADTLAQLRALPVPVGQEAALTAIWAKIDKIFPQIDQAIAALKAGDLDTFSTIGAQIDKDTDAANAASNAYGLTVCGS